jgi:hypothetical protein
VQWVDAHLEGDAELATFYERRFRDEFRPAFLAWLATDPFDDPDAPPSPFVMDAYVLDAREEATRLERAADALSAQARDDVQRATNYVLGVVLFAIVLFCAGIGAKVGNERIQRAVVGVGAAVFLVAVAWIATFPISLSI